MTDPNTASVAKEAAGVAGPPGSLVKALMEYQRLAAMELHEASRSLSDLLALERQRVYENKGVFKRAVRHRNAGGANVGYAGITRLELNDVHKDRTRAISFITAPVLEAAGATPETDLIYVKFGRGMGFDSAENIPSNFDLVMSRGGKLNRFSTPQGLESITFYALRSFDALVFMTAGDPASLPTF